MVIRFLRRRRRRRPILILGPIYASDGAVTYPAPGPDPLPRPLLLRLALTTTAFKTPTDHNLEGHGRPVVTSVRQFTQTTFATPLGRRFDIRRYRSLMLNRDLASTALPHEADRGGEDTATPLSRLHRPRQEALPIPHPFDLVHDRNLRISGEEERAVHRVHDETGRHGGLSRGEGLRDGCAAEDAACAGRMPERVGICVDGGRDVGERVELQDRFDWRHVRQARRWLQEGCTRSSRSGHFSHEGCAPLRTK